MKTFSKKYQNWFITSCAKKKQGQIKRITLIRKIEQGDIDIIDIESKFY